jgi:deoxyribodipyrimidine photo-lyase
MDSIDLPSQVPAIRIRQGNSNLVRTNGDFVLYWMIANRRSTYNFSLDRAVDWADHLQKPLVIFEALRCDYRWASDRIHSFVVDGMRANAAAFKQESVLYYPYLEPKIGAGKGALNWLAKRAAVVISDDFPCFFLPRMVTAAAEQIPVRFELVDSNGLFPMRATDRVFARAFDFRRFLQKNLVPHLAEVPRAQPFKKRRLLAPPKTLLGDFEKRWPRLDTAKNIDLGKFPIDHSVEVVQELPGGSSSANARMQSFLKSRLQDYGEKRNEPEVEGASGLSPYLHFGHVSVHEIFAWIVKTFEWTPEMVNPKAKGSSQGWWGLNASVESFLDELITWRELGYNRCALTDDFDRYESLPEWAQATLQKHAKDPRPVLYSLKQMEQSATHDQLWNAAQTQLVREGRIHNYLRMLWGKKVLEWSATPREALASLIELNNKYALDGRNPNSYSGIFWVLGRYDRAWGPERPIFGTIRYMSSDNTARKFSVKGYLKKYSGTVRID